MRITGFTIAFFFACRAFGQEGPAHPIGYVYCQGQSATVIMAVLDPCEKDAGAVFHCGQKVKVLGRTGDWLQVEGQAGVSPFIKIKNVSQEPDQLRPFEMESGPVPECKSSQPDLSKNRPPKVIFQRYPDYPSHAPASDDVKTVVLKLVVGTDGKPHDIKVDASVGKEFDKNAVEAVRDWRFEPALKDGKPVEASISLEIEFRLIARIR